MLPGEVVASPPARRRNNRPLSPPHTHGEGRPSQGGHVCAGPWSVWVAGSHTNKLCLVSSCSAEGGQTFMCEINGGVSLLDEQKMTVHFYRENMRCQLTWSNPGVVCSLSESTFVVQRSQQASGNKQSLAKCSQARGRGQGIPQRPWSHGVGGWGS